jgi:hypothetical protein
VALLDKAGGAALVDAIDVAVIQDKYPKKYLYFLKYNYNVDVGIATTRVVRYCWIG